jgi:hypothetical protein
VWPERANSLELWPQIQIIHVLSVADSSRPRLDFSALSAHTRLMLELLKTEAVVIIACNGRLLLLLLLLACHIAVPYGCHMSCHRMMPYCMSFSHVTLCYLHSDPACSTMEHVCRLQLGTGVRHPQTWLRPPEHVYEDRTGGHRCSGLAVHHGHLRLSKYIR